MVTAYPAMLWLVHEPSFSRLLTVELWFSFLYGSYNGAMVVFLDRDYAGGCEDFRLRSGVQSGHGDLWGIYSGAEYLSDSCFGQPRHSRTVAVVCRRLRAGGNNICQTAKHGGAEPANSGSRSTLNFGEPHRSAQVSYATLTRDPEMPTLREAPACAMRNARVWPSKSPSRDLTRLGLPRSPGPQRSKNSN